VLVGLCSICVIVLNRPAEEIPSDLGVVITGSEQASRIATVKFEMGDKRSYNLPGYGLVEYQLYPHAKKVFELLDRRGHIERLRSTDHLGTLRDIFPGAHHTRYARCARKVGLVGRLTDVGTQDA